MTMVGGLGSALGSHPYALMVRDFHKIIGEEALYQIKLAEGRLPDRVLACVGGGSNAIGIFHAFIPESSVRLIGVEAGGRSGRLGDHASRFAGGANSAVRNRSFSAGVPIDTRKQRSSSGYALTSRTSTPWL